MTDLGTLGGNQSDARSINDNGQVVGNSFVADNSKTQAILWEDSRIINLNDLIPANSGWDLSGAVSINNAGQIIGWGTHLDENHAFHC